MFFDDEDPTLFQSIAGSSKSDFANKSRRRSSIKRGRKSLLRTLSSSEITESNQSSTVMLPKSLPSHQEKRAFIKTKEDIIQYKAYKRQLEKEDKQWDQIYSQSFSQSENDLPEIELGSEVKDFWKDFQSECMMNLEKGIASVKSKHEEEIRMMQERKYQVEDMKTRNEQYNEIVTALRDRQLKRSKTEILSEMQLVENNLAKMKECPDLNAIFALELDM